IGSAASAFPAAQWIDVNNPTTIHFNLTASQVAAHTLRIGLTAATAGGRPAITLNSFTSPNPSPSSQPTSPTLPITPSTHHSALSTSAPSSSSTALIRSSSA